MAVLSAAQLRNETQLNEMLSLYMFFQAGRLTKLTPYKDKKDRRIGR
jgi:hypothetical protein